MRERDRTLRSKSVSEVGIAADCLREGGRELLDEEEGGV